MANILLESYIEEVGYGLTLPKVVCLWQRHVQKIDGYRDDIGRAGIIQALSAMFAHGQTTAKNRRRFDGVLRAFATEISRPDLYPHWRRSLDSQVPHNSSKRDTPKLGPVFFASAGSPFYSIWDLAAEMRGRLEPNECDKLAEKIEAARGNPGVFCPKLRQLAHQLIRDSFSYGEASIAESWIVAFDRECPPKKGEEAIAEDTTTLLRTYEVPTELLGLEIAPTVLFGILLFVGRDTIQALSQLKQEVPHLSAHALSEEATSLLKQRFTPA